MQQIGKYQLIEQIGVGGFGEVFKGFDPYIKRHVAIKTCSSKSEEIRSRFFQEAEIAGNLHHRNITTVYDFGVEGDLPYLIQEYLSGEDLDAKIRRKDYLPFAEKLFYLIQIARGLAEAHIQGVMHRDIKPANVRILEDGMVKIMDFGIAKLAQQQTGLTQTGMTLGTAAYLSPEQIRGDSMDVRTDIFSFGVLAYELLAYERPFRGEQISAVLYQLLNNDPKPITDCWPAAPPEVVELLDRCLQKSPARRFQDGADLLRALEGIQRKGRERSDVYGQAKPRTEPPTVRLDSAEDLAQKPNPQRGLDDFDLTGSSPTITDEPALARPETPQRLAPRSGSGARPSKTSSSLTLTLGIGAALVIVAGLVGWWMGDRGPKDAEATQAAEVSVNEPEVEDVASSTGGGATDGSITPASSATGPTAEPEAPVVEKGRILVPSPAWTDAMTVRVGRNGKTWPLTRRRSFRLDPGSYDLHFELSEPGYSRQKSVRVTVAEGADRTVSPPIPRPAALTVLASPGRPQGEVLLAGSSLGQTPVRRRLLEPAGYVLEIRPRGETDAANALTQSLDLTGGQETIVTFDLSSKRVRVSKKPVKSGKN